MFSFKVCPDGFDLLDNSRCVKVMNTGKTKTEADADCKGESPRASLLTPKSRMLHDKLEHYLIRNPLTPDQNAEFFVGITHKEGQWQWDDTKDSVFTESMFNSQFPINSYFKINLFEALSFSNHILKTAELA